MRSTQLPLNSYDTDKITGRYLDSYDPVLQPWVDKPVKLLELGVKNGGSLMLWRDYFPLGTIVGIDINLPKGLSPGERVHVFEGSQSDPRFLSEVANRVAPEGFDIIIDDASHIGELTRIAFWHLFDNHLKPGGLYVIEDWGTGYWDDFPDGKSVVATERQPKMVSPDNFAKVPFPCHSYGMVGFVKELVDEQGAHDLTRRRFDNTKQGIRNSKFQSLLIVPSIVFVRKRE